MGKKGSKLGQWKRQEEVRREKELFGKKNRTGSAKERILRERERERERKHSRDLESTSDIIVKM